MIWGTLQSNGFWPLQSLCKNSNVHWDSNSQSGNSLGSVGVHSLTLFDTPRSMKCDFRASPGPHLHKPKVRIATLKMTNFDIIRHQMCNYRKGKMNKRSMAKTITRETKRKGQKMNNPQVPKKGRELLPFCGRKLFHPWPP